MLFLLYGKTIKVSEIGRDENNLIDQQCINYVKIINAYIFTYM